MVPKSVNLGVAFEFYPLLPATSVSGMIRRTGVLDPGFRHSRYRSIVRPFRRFVTRCSRIVGWPKGRDPRGEDRLGV